MSLPIATQNCYHTCPAYDGPKAHVGGPIIKGSENVFASKIPVSRLGDQVQCNSPAIDQITGGSSTVYANGKSVARKNDSTAHGGIITQGNPTVLVG